MFVKAALTPKSATVPTNLITDSSLLVLRHGNHLPHRTRSQFSAPAQIVHIEYGLDILQTVASNRGDLWHGASSQRHPRDCCTTKVMEGEVSDASLRATFPP
ncbi:hypothetical protein D3C80_1311460 [compost metagenome]